MFFSYSSLFYLSPAFSICPPVVPFCSLSAQRDKTQCLQGFIGILSPCPPCPPHFWPFLVAVLLCLPTIKKAAAVSNSSLSRSPLHHAGGDMFTPCGFFIIRRPCQGFTAAQSGAHSLKRKSPHCCMISARALNISERR